MGRTRDEILAVSLADATLGAQATQNKCTAMEVLHLCDEGITKFGEGMERYRSLEVLWLSNNKLRNLAGLQRNRRLKELYLNNNQLSSLGEVKHLKNLEVLMLGGNRLSGLEQTCSQLHQLPRLTQLDVSDNPLMNQPNARLYLLFHLPRLDVLDRAAATTRERVEADKLARKLGWGMFAGCSSRKKHQGRKPMVLARTMPMPTRSPSVLERDCHRRVHRIYRWRASQKRAAEREACRGWTPALFDPRNTEPPTKGLQEPSGAASFKEQLAEATASLSMQRGAKAHGRRMARRAQIGCGDELLQTTLYDDSYNRRTKLLETAQTFRIDQPDWRLPMIKTHFDVGRTIQFEHTKTIMTSKFLL